jgi:RNA polymerase sigma-70 factor (ECF subfamily)
MDEKLQNAINGCLNHDRRAQKALYDLCFPPMMALCLRYQKNRDTAVELLNEAFLKVLLNLKTYDQQRPFFTWVGTLTVRTAIDWHRKSLRHTHESLEDYHHESAELDAATSTLPLEEILEMIQQLPDGERLVFNLFEIEGFAHLEIASQLQISERSSKRHLQQAKSRLKQWILSKQFVMF